MIKFLQKIATGIALLVFFVLVFVGICCLKPELTTSLGGWLRTHTADTASGNEIGKGTENPLEETSSEEAAPGENSEEISEEASESETLEEVLEEELFLETNDNTAVENIDSATEEIVEETIAQEIVWNQNSDSHLKSVEEAGFSYADVKDNLAAYYDDCYDKITTTPGNPVSFSNVVTDYQLMEDIYNSYQNHSYEAGYANRALAAIGASTWSVQVTIDRLQNDCYQISHKVTLEY